MVHADPARIEQVVSNLLDNALKYTPAGGHVRVATGRSRDRAMLSVRDTGKGIRPDVLSRVFDLFVQEPQALDRARGGLGLGLTLVKRLIEMHGGSVAATSAGPGLGSEFCVFLPILEMPDERGDGEAADPSPTRVRRRVLIVEDGADARESLRLLLELAGHEVATAEDGPDGLREIERFRPDVALVDLGLPGIDGYDVARGARNGAHGRHVRLVALTGYGQAADQRRALEAGFDVHLTKPVDPSTLEKLLAG
jgi:CheY-like chemotaxis protein